MIQRHFVFDVQITFLIFVILTLNQIKCGWFFVGLPALDVRVNGLGLAQAQYVKRNMVISQGR